MGTAVGIITAIGSIAGLLIWVMRYFLDPKRRKRKRDKVIRQITKAIVDKDHKKFNKLMRKLHALQD